MLHYLDSLFEHWIKSGETVKRLSQVWLSYEVRACMFDKRSDLGEILHKDFIVTCTQIAQNKRPMYYTYVDILILKTTTDFAMFVSLLHELHLPEY